jgi:hypothetical protein
MMLQAATGEAEALLPQTEGAIDGADWPCSATVRPYDQLLQSSAEVSSIAAAEEGWLILHTELAALHNKVNCTNAGGEPQVGHVKPNKEANATVCKKCQTCNHCAVLHGFSRAHKQRVRWKATRH